MSAADHNQPRGSDGPDGFESDPGADAAALPPSPGAPARLAVGIISAGRVGTALGEALERVGHVVVAASAPSAAAANRLAERLPEARVATPAEVARSSELLVLAVPDPALSDVIGELAASGAVRPGHIVIHSAGALGAAALRPFHRIGAVVAATHPAMTFVGAPSDADKLAGSGWGVTAPDEIGQAVGESLVIEMGGRPVRIEESQRALYHAALAHGSNHLVTLIADALAALELAIGGPDGRSDPDGRAPNLLGPLVRAALENALASGDAALTGPVMRGDVDTVRRHLEVLGGADAGIADGYRSLALRTARKRRSGAAMLEAIGDNGSPDRPEGREPDRREGRTEDR
ncbi:Rossmann-like and DUF2520 domain-containing protein [Dietzia sp.]|uniref:Rossmann-like and DUF2520 domain-containing protein n=1 Tax=Dietzia sp. TaxID=1871616 RepID=UPI002FD96096